MGGKTVFVKNSSERDTASEILGSRSVLDAGAFRSDSEPKYYMSRTVYRYVPMMQLQASLVNSAIGNRTSPDKYLSPRQLEILSHNIVATDTQSIMVPQAKVAP